MTTLYQSLRDLLQRHDYLWPSESDMPIEAVILESEELEGWEYINDAYTQVYVASRASDDFTGAGWTRLRAFFAEHPGKAYRRPNGKPSEFDLAIVTRQPCGLWVGIMTTIIET